MSFLNLLSASSKRPVEPGRLIDATSLNSFFQKVCEYAWLTFPFTKNNNIWLFVLQLARHLFHLLNFNIWRSSILSNKICFRTFSVVRVANSLILYSSDVPSLSYLSTKYNWSLRSSSKFINSVLCVVKYNLRSIFI